MRQPGGVLRTPSTSHDGSWSPQEDGYALRITIRGYEGYEGTAPLTGPALSVVGDAEGNEGEEMTFTVTLSEATEAEVTAMWTASQENMTTCTTCGPGRFGDDDGAGVHRGRRNDGNVQGADGGRLDGRA